jgi:tetratricopeptide (TPR) repeat protein
MEQGLDEFRRLADPWGQAFAMYHLVRALRIGRVQVEYVRNRQPLLEAVRAAGDRYLLADVLVIEYGLGFMKRGEWQQAEAAFLEADALLAEIGSSRRNLNRYYFAQLYFLLGDPEKAKIEADAALEYCQRVGEKNTHAFVRMFLGMVAETQGNLPEALSDQQAYLDLIKEIGTPRHIVWGYALVGRLQYLENQRDSSLINFRQGVEVLKQCEKELGDLSYFFVHAGGLFINRRPDLTIRVLSFIETLSTNQRDQIFYQPYFNLFLGEARGKLGEAEFNSAWEAGLEITTEKAIDLVERELEKL